jgi:hypothetical protein
MKKYKVMEDTEALKEGDILIEDQRNKYIYCAGNICTTIWTIDKNPEKFEVIEE